MEPSIGINNRLVLGELPAALNSTTFAEPQVVRTRARHSAADVAFVRMANFELNF